MIWSRRLLWLTLRTGCDPITPWLHDCYVRSILSCSLCLTGLVISYISNFNFSLVSRYPFSLCNDNYYYYCRYTTSTYSYTTTIPNSLDFLNNSSELDFSLTSLSPLMETGRNNSPSLILPNILSPQQLSRNNTPSCRSGPFSLHLTPVASPLSLPHLATPTKSSLLPRPQPTRILLPSLQHALFPDSTTTSADTDVGTSSSSQSLDCDVKLDFTIVQTKRRKPLLQTKDGHKLYLFKTNKNGTLLFKCRATCPTTKRRCGSSATLDADQETVLRAVICHNHDWILYVICVNH